LNKQEKEEQDNYFTDKLSIDHQKLPTNFSFTTRRRRRKRRKRRRRRRKRKYCITSNCFSIIQNPPTNNEILLCVNSIPLKPSIDFGHNGYGRTP
jgi:hypothetical protein